MQRESRVNYAVARIDDENPLHAFCTARSREEERAKLKEDVEMFLAAGGQIITLSLYATGFHESGMTNIEFARRSPSIRRGSTAKRTH